MAILPRDSARRAFRQTPVPGEAIEEPLIHDGPAMNVPLVSGKTRSAMIAVETRARLVARGRCRGKTSDRRDAAADVRPALHHPRRRRGKLERGWTRRPRVFDRHRIVDLLQNQRRATQRLGITHPLASGTCPVSSRASENSASEPQRHLLGANWPRTNRLRRPGPPGPARPRHSGTRSPGAALHRTGTQGHRNRGGAGHRGALRSRRTVDRGGAATNS